MKGAVTQGTSTLHTPTHAQTHEATKCITESKQWHNFTHNVPSNSMTGCCCSIPCLSCMSCWAITDNTSISIRLNSSRHVQEPDWARPAPRQPSEGERSKTRIDGHGRTTHFTPSLSPEAHATPPYTLNPPPNPHAQADSEGGREAAKTNIPANSLPIIL